mgnify:CR=1 FL=1
MSEQLDEAGERLQQARDRAVEAREALERDQGGEEAEDQDVWDVINSALYDIDYALAKATWTTKDYMNQAVDAADEGYDELLEDLLEVRRGLADLREDLAGSRPSEALAQWFSDLEERLEVALRRLRGDERS